MNQVVGSWSAMVVQPWVEIARAGRPSAWFLSPVKHHFAAFASLLPIKDGRRKTGGVRFGVRFVDTKKLQCIRAMILTKANEMVVFLV